MILCDLVFLLQIEVLQSRLESLRDEKHQLFQQLKTVLHEEDERKRQKEVDQKQQYVITEWEARQLIMQHGGRIWASIYVYYLYLSYDA